MDHLSRELTLGLPGPWPGGSPDESGPSGDRPAPSRAPPGHAEAPPASSRSHPERPLESREKQLVAILGVPTFALALAITVVTTYLPVVAQQVVGSTVVIGLIVGLEGLVPLMPESEHGASTGYYSLSRGFGTWLGPLLGGAAIAISAGVFDATRGYQAIFGVCALAALLSLLPLRRLESGEPAPR